MDSEPESQGRRDSDATLDGSEIESSKSSEYSGSLSSSSSVSSSDDYIQVDPKLPFKSISSDVASNNKSHPDAKVLSQNDHTDPNFICHQLEESSKLSTSSTSQVSDVTHESIFLTMLPTQSPSIQVMDRQAGFDPNRIPSSVFGSKQSSSKEWSNASNESLFSIHTAGNVSPGRDDSLMIDGDFKRSRKRDNCRETDKTEEIKRPCRMTLLAAKGGERKEKFSKKERKVDSVSNLLPAGSSDEPTKRVVRFKEEAKLGAVRDHSTAIVLSDGNACYKDSCSAVRPSDNNAISSAGSALPIKVKSVGWSCCCSCNWGSCCSSWPSYILKRSGCSCKCLSCSGCSFKWLSGSVCSFKWLSCSECSFKWLSCSGCSCKWLSCSGCSCRWPSCHCKCLTSLRCCC